MQRLLVIVAMILLVLASLGIGAMTAHWPFWRRAWAWHVAPDGWPATLSAPHAVVRGGGGVPLRFDAAAADLAAAAGRARTRLLLRVQDGRADAWFAPGADEHEPIDGRGLTAALLPPLFAALAARHPGLLDAPVGARLEAWRQDARGALTARELLVHAADGRSWRESFTPLNPFSPAAQLASGPDYHRAALAVFNADPAARAGNAPAARQLLAAIAAAAEGSDFAAVLEGSLWSRVAAGDARLWLDRPRGQAAAHCCLVATAADWLRLGLHLAGSEAAADAGAAGRVFITSGRALVVSPRQASALLWVGEGAPPSGLETLLPVPAAESGLALRTGAIRPVQ
jgi:hypothetical protein